VIEERRIMDWGGVYSGEGRWAVGILDGCLTFRPSVLYYALLTIGVG
jgi:hypothetical protein